MIQDEIIEIEEIGESNCYDISFTCNKSDFINAEPNFIANEIIVHNCGLHETYCNRKKGKEEFEIHPLLKSFMESTYNVLCYQEQTLRMLNVVGKIPLKDCEAVRKAISKKKIDKFKSYKEIFIENGQITLGWTKERVEELWNQIESFAGYGFNLSHAVAYSYVSARMLYLKCHYPEAFYPAFLNNFDATGPKDYKKIKEYKQDIERHGLKVKRVDINKSKAKFYSNDKNIHYAFAKLREVGEEAAKRIEENQPYTDYEDFFDRFGTDASVNVAVIALRLFPGDPVANYKFYIEKKLYKKKKADREKRRIALETKLLKQKNGLLLQLESNATKEDPDLKEIILEELKKWENKWNEFVKKYSEYGTPPRLKNYTRNSEIKVPKNELKSYETTMSILDSPEKCEETYYGFIWDHPLEKCKEYSNYTFEAFEGNEIGPVEVLVKNVEKLQGKVTYYKAHVEDAIGQNGKITIWDRDYKRFNTEIKKNNMIRISIKAPTPPYTNYTIADAPGNRWNPSPKDLDFRVKVLGTI